VAIVNLSFDYEMAWGQLSNKAPALLNAAVRENVLKGMDNVPKVLDSLRRYQVFTTWGIVGATSYKDWDDLHAATPTLQKALQQSNMLDVGGLREKFPVGELFFSPELVKQITTTENIEIVSHGGYHLYLGDERLPDSIALDDLRFSLSRLGVLADREVTGFIAPRNQVEKEQVIIDAGIKITRPNPLLFNRIRYSSELPFAGFVRLYSDLVSPSFCKYLDKKASLLFLRIDRSDAIFKKQYDLIKEKINNYGKDTSFFFYIHPHNFAKNDAVEKFQKIIELFAALRDEGKITLCDLWGNKPNAV
jgi:peptidoglycan/xylan/chitin deacetylase (PgdA/CDA1 family)